MCQARYFCGEPCLDFDFSAAAVFKATRVEMLVQFHTHINCSAAPFFQGNINACATNRDTRIDEVTYIPT